MTGPGTPHPQYLEWINGTWLPPRRQEDFDYPNGTRFFQPFLPGPGQLQHIFYNYRRAIYPVGSPLETNGNGQAVIGRGPYIAGTWEFPESEIPDAYEDLMLFTGYGAGLVTGAGLHEFDVADDGNLPIDGFFTRDKRNTDDFYEVRLSAGSPGPYGTGILRVLSLLDVPMQICWNQSEGVWVEWIVYESVMEGDLQVDVTISKVTIPLAAPSPNARTVGVRARTNAVNPTDRLYDFAIDGVIVARSVDANTGQITNDTNTVPIYLRSFFNDPDIRVFVVNPVPESALEPWGSRPMDDATAQELNWGGSLEGIAPPEGAPLLYYPGERYPILDWMHTWHEMELVPAEKIVTPPLHQSRADFLAAGGAYRYQTARTRQASIWQNAHL